MGDSQLGVLPGGKHGQHGFDPYPYILLNLFLPMLPGVQAAALLIAAKRSDAVPSEMAIDTEHNTDDIKQLVAKNTGLTREVKRNTDVRSDRRPGRARKGARRR